MFGDFIITNEWCLVIWSLQMSVVWWFNHYKWVVFGDLIITNVLCLVIRSLQMSGVWWFDHYKCAVSGELIITNVLCLVIWSLQMSVVWWFAVSQSDRGQAVTGCWDSPVHNPPGDVRDWTWWVTLDSVTQNASVADRLHRWHTNQCWKYSWSWTRSVV